MQVDSLIPANKLVSSKLSLYSVICSSHAGLWKRNEAVDIFVVFYMDNLKIWANFLLFTKYIIVRIKRPITKKVGF